MEHIISGLITKRSEMAGQIEFYQNEIRKLKMNLHHVDNTIKIISPDIDLRTIKSKKVHKRNKYFEVGELNKLILGILRDANRELSTNDIVLEVMSAKNISPNNMEALKAIKKLVPMALKRQSNNGIVNVVGKVDKKILVWGIKKVLSKT